MSSCESSPTVYCQNNCAFDQDSNSTTVQFCHKFIRPNSYPGLEKYSRGQKNVSNFVPFRWASIPFWNAVHLPLELVPFRIVAVHAFVWGPSFARCEGFTVKMFLLAPAWVLPTRFAFALTKTGFAPPLASLYRICGRRVTRNSQRNGNVNRMER